MAGKIFQWRLRYRLFNGALLKCALRMLTPTCGNVFTGPTSPGRQFADGIPIDPDLRPFLNLEAFVPSAKFPVRVDRAGGAFQVMNGISHNTPTT